MLGESRQLINTGTQENHVSYRVIWTMPRPDAYITEWLLEHNFTCKAIDKENAQLINNRAPHLYQKEHTLIHVFYKDLPRRPSDDHKAPRGASIIRLHGSPIPQRHPTLRQLHQRLQKPTLPPRTITEGAD